MTIHRAKSGRLFGAATLVLLFAVFSANARGGDGCVAFQATYQGSFRPPSQGPRGWVVNSVFTMGDVVLQGTIFYSSTDIVAEKKTRNVLQGVEKGVVTVEGVGTFDLVSHFTSPHRTFKQGAAILNESGTIGNGAGAFAGVSGHFTDHGVYGPAVPGASVYGTIGFVGSMNGNICGLDLNDPRFASTSN